MDNISYKEKWEKEFETYILSIGVKDPANEWRELFSNEQIIYIYGAGHLGRVTANCFHKWGMSITSFVDRDPKKAGKEIIWSISCILPEQMEKDALILVAVEEGYEDAHKLCMAYSEKVYNASNLAWLKAERVREIATLPMEELLSIKNRISNVFEMLEDERSVETYYYILSGLFFEKPYHKCFEKSYCDRNEYFRKEIFNSSECRNYIDCGAYEGDTFEKYLDFVEQSFDAAYLFEMDEHSAKVLEKKVKEYGNGIEKATSIFNMGVYDKETKLSIADSVHNGMVLLDANGEKNQELDTLDHCIGDHVVDFIKMDIEGSEMAGLRGAQNLIRKNKPNLAICIYHKAEDLWEIPEYVKQLVPEYRIYIRHCSHYDQDMILYASIR